MSDPIDVRRLGLNDVGLAEETIRVIKTDGNLSEVASLDSAGMQAWLSRPSNILITATADGIPVGFALGYLLDRVDEARTMLFFYEVEVSAPYRKRGIGRRLVEAMKAVAREENTLKMWVQTDPDNIAARELYRSTGGVEDASSDLLYVWADQARSDHSVPSSCSKTSKKDKRRSRSSSPHLAPGGASCL